MYKLPIYENDDNDVGMIKPYINNFIKKHRDRKGLGMFTHGSYVRRALKKKHNATYPDVHDKDFKYKVENLNLIFESELDRTAFLLRWS